MPLVWWESACGAPMAKSPRYLRAGDGHGCFVVSFYTWAISLVWEMKCFYQINWDVACFAP